MPPPDRSAGVTAEWLAYADADLEYARVGNREKLLPALVCFHAQQAAEK